MSVLIHTCTSGTDANTYWTDASNAWNTTSGIVAYRDATVMENAYTNERSKYLKFYSDSTASGIGTIRSVEIGFISYTEPTTYGNTEQELGLQVTFSGLGDSQIMYQRQETTASGYATYMDITEADNAPSSWSWWDVQNLSLKAWCNTTYSGSPNRYYIDQVKIRVNYGSVTYDEVVTDGFQLNDRVTVSGGTAITYFADDDFEVDLSVWDEEDGYGGASTSVSGGNYWVTLTTTSGEAWIGQTITDDSYRQDLQFKYGETQGLLPPYILPNDYDGPYGRAYSIIQSGYVGAYTISGGDDYSETWGWPLYTTYSGTYSFDFRVYKAAAGFGMNYALSRSYNKNVYYDGASSVSAGGETSARSGSISYGPYFRIIEVIDPNKFSITLYSSASGIDWHKELQYSADGLDNMERNGDMNIYFGGWTMPGAEGTTTSGVGIYAQSWEYFLNTDTLENS